MADPADVCTSAWLEQEIQAAEEALDHKERKLLALDDSEQPQEASVPERLGRVDRAADELLLAQDMTAWVSTKDENRNEDGESSNDLVQDAQECIALGEILCRHAPRNPSDTSSSLYNDLYQQEYTPLYDFLSKRLVLSLRQSLRRSKYPSAAGCRALLTSRAATLADPSGVSLETIIQHGTTIKSLDSMHRKVLKCVKGISQPGETMDPLLLELVRPILQRVRFHFVEVSNDRPTSTRTDRLPEWLLTYIRDNVLQGGPWDIVLQGLAPTFNSLPLDFLNELVRLVQWVVGERNFFRHVQVAGPNSNPLLMCNAVEQIIQFDDTLQNILVSNQGGRLLSLMDIFVAGDDELLHWWLQREREAVLYQLFEEPITQTSLLHRVSPRAELFAALMRSIQAKAAVFTFSGPYMHHVAAPLCLEFLDALHETASDLRQRWTKRRSTALSEVDLRSMVTEWIELINGTHMAAEVVAMTEWSQDAAPDLSGDEDVARFGKSLLGLQDVLLQEFATTFVDTLLLERAKFAGYLMRCSHLLSSNDQETELSVDVSPDLQETQWLLHAFLAVCEEAIVDTESEAAASEIAGFAPRRMRDRALDQVAAHLLEVALDAQGMTPDLCRPGAMAFARDVDSLFASSLVPHSALRLLDVTQLMTTESRQLVQLGNALCGLAGQSPPLTEDFFSVDSRLLEEAMSMVRAKGLVWIELGDVFAVLNRRRDLSEGSPVQH